MQIANERKLKVFLRSTKQEHIERAILPALGRIHAEMTGPEQKDFNSAIAGLPAGVKPMVRRIMRAIGEANFVAVTMDEAAQTINERWQNRFGTTRGGRGTRTVEVSPQEPTSTYVYTAPEQTEQPEDISEVPGVVEDPNAEVPPTPEEVVEESEEEAEEELPPIELLKRRFEEYEQGRVEFPPWRRRAAVLWVKNIKAGFDNFKTFEHYGMDTEDIVSGIQSRLDTLDLWRQETAPPAADQTEESKEPTTRGGATVAKPGESVVDDNDKQNLEEEESQGAATGLDDDEVVDKVAFLKEAGTFLTIDESGMPTINMEAVNTTYANFRKELLAIADQAIANEMRAFISPEFGGKRKEMLCRSERSLILSSMQ